MKLSIYLLSTAAVLGLILIAVSEGTTTRYCKRPSYIKNGRYFYQRKLTSKRLYRIGSVLEIKCNNGYRLEGQRYMRCQYGSNRIGVWAGRLPICKFYRERSRSNSRSNSDSGRQKCPSLRSPNNGYVKIKRRTAFYGCKNGAILQGNRIRKCQSNGHWTGSKPWCKPKTVNCGDPGKPQNGYRKLKKTTPGSHVTYFCNKGHYLVGESKRKCLTSGRWSGKLPVCKALCSQLSAPSNGRVHVEGVKAGSHAKYSCNEGYRLKGEKIRVCQNGKWSGKKPSCQAITCKPLTAPENGAVSFQSLIKGSTATYSCNDGFKLVGDKTRQCLNTCQWSKKEPICKSIDCGDPGTPQNGIKRLIKTTPGSYVTYFCDKGHYLVGEGKRKCLPSGRWSGELPVCKAFCPQLSAPSNGLVEVEGVKEGSHAKYSCIKGYRLKGEENRVCLEGGKWSGEEPICKAITCKPLTAPENGEVSFQSLIKGSTATYSCNDGFKLVGDKTRQCLITGQWSDNEPICEPIDCGDLPAPVNGKVELDGTIAGSTAIYSCLTGYELIGVESRECLDSGKWSEEAPTCEAIDCGSLEAPASGSINLSGTTVGSIATYSCFFSYQLVGVEERECLESGQWSEEPPICKPIKCPQLQDPQNGKVDFASTILSSIATYSCNKGFVLNGTKDRECQLNGEWSGSEPQCTELKCPQLKNPMYGSVTTTSRTIGSKAYYTCEIGFTLSGANSRTCEENGRWSGEEPLCIPIESTNCKTLPNPEYGKVVANGITVGSKAYYSCDYGYNLTKGSPVRTCQEDHEWSGTAGVCEPVQCPILSVPANGEVSYKSNLFLSEAIYRCFPGFDLIGPLFRRCQGDGKWTGKDPHCSKTYKE